MYVLPKLNDRQQRIMEVYDRISTFYHVKLAMGGVKNCLSSKMMRYGLQSIVCGDLPEGVKEEARDWLQEMHRICEIKGFDSTRMFVGDMAKVVVEYEFEVFGRSRDRFDKARYKLARLALSENISALKVETSLIGSTFVRHLEYCHRDVLYFNQEDKQRLFDAKNSTIEAILDAINTLSTFKLTKGYDTEAVDSSIGEFLDCARISTWVSIRENTIYYYNKTLSKAGHSVICNSEPKPGDNWRSFNIVFELYANFDQDEDWGYPVSGITFSVHGGTPI